MKHLAIALLGTSALSISACAPTSLSGSAMMRVEVDVYKGPVGTSHKVQEGELIELVNQAAIASDKLEKWARSYTLDLEGDIDAKRKELGEETEKLAELENTGEKLNAERKYLERRLKSSEKAGDVDIINEIEERIDKNNRENVRVLAEIKHATKNLNYINSQIKKLNEKSLLRGIQLACTKYNTGSEKCNDEKYDRDYRILIGLKEDAAEVREQACIIVARYIVDPQNIGISRREAERKLDRFRGDLKHCAKDKDYENLATFIAYSEDGDRTSFSNRSGQRSRSRSSILLLSNQVQELSAVATMMQNKARRAADANISYVPKNRKVRELSANLAYTYSEFAKNISSRTLLYDNLAQRCEKDRDAARAAILSEDDNPVGDLQVKLEEMKKAGGRAFSDWQDAKFKAEQISRDPDIKDQKTIDDKINALQVEKKRDASKDADRIYSEVKNELDTELARIDSQAAAAFDKCVSEYDRFSSKLPTSAYLRDVEPTRYLDAFKWFDADQPKEGSDAFRLKNRITGIRALNAGLYWEKVNEVYASGQGDVSMAFVKDELGNWNLKSYTNDPAELLEAYRGGFDAILKSAVKTIRKASGDPTALAEGGSLLDIADRLATGRSAGSTNVGGVSITLLHDRTNDRLKKLQTRVNERVAILDGDENQKDSILKAEAEVKNAQGQVAISKTKTLPGAMAEESSARQAFKECVGDCEAASTRFDTAILATAAARIEAANAESNLQTKKNELAVLKAERRQIGGAAAEKARDILDEHRRELITLQKVAASDNASSPVPQPK